MKQRITGLDLQILSKELETLLSYRLQNIYNLTGSDRQYLLKFAIPDSKKQVVIDCGNKVHLTDFERPTTPTPSNFVTKLRKHLKSRRVTGLRQVGTDRVLVFQFSDGLYYLVLEFFSAGNVLLLDGEKKIMALQRTVRERGDVSRYAVNEPYMFDVDLLFANNEGYQMPQKVGYSTNDIKKWLENQRVRLSANQDKKKKVLSIHKLLFVNSSHLSSELVLKNLSNSLLDANASSFDLADNDNKMAEAVKVLENAEDDYLQLVSSDHIRGVVVSKRNPNYDSSDSKSLEFTFEEFHPFKPFKPNESNYKFTEIEGYNNTLDSFFSTVESSKYALKIEQQKIQASNRLLHAKEERNKQIQNLVDQQKSSVVKADSIIHSMDLVESIKEYINKLISKQMDWKNIEDLINLEKGRGHRLSKHIKLPLNLKDNKISLLIPDPNFRDLAEGNDYGYDSEESSDSADDTESEDENDSDYDSDDGFIKSKKTAAKPKSKSTKKVVSENLIQVVIDLSLSAFANASLYYDDKKNAESKKQKVEEKSEIALKNAEKKITQDLNRKLKNEHDTLKQIRLKYWFEKFFWFVTSDGYLCLAGRDPHQTDMIYFRHFSDNDYFVSSDIEGSLKVFIKNPFKGEDVSPMTLMQAGIFALSASKAWNSKITTSSWVLRGTDVSKIDYDGSLLPTAMFNYKGEKSYLPPSQLVMGFGFYWIGDEETTSRYRKQRVEKEETHGLKILLDSKKKDLQYLVEQSKTDTSDQAPLREPTTLAKADAELVEDKDDNQKDCNKKGVNEKDENVAESVQDEVDEAQMEKVNGGPVEDHATTSAIRQGKKGKVDQDEDFVDPIQEKLKELNVGVKVKSTQKPPNVRGKKSKLKKMQKKYGNQDEEERKLRMEALGTWKQKEESEKKEVKQAEAKQEKRPQEHVLRQRKQDEREYRKYLLGEANEDESSTTNYLEILDSFIAKPAENDTIVDVVPVFAPWSSLNKFKYKVKIQPGAGKKGKCINDTLNYFTTRKLDKSRTDSDIDWENEREILKSFKSNDFVANFTMSKVKLVLPDNKSSRENKSGRKKK